MDGIFVNYRRPASKAELKRLAVQCPEAIDVEFTAVTHAGPSVVRAITLPPGFRTAFVGPDPRTDRRFYGTLRITPAGNVRIE